MRDVIVTAEKRDGIGKGVARKLRRAGKIPAILYGNGASIPLAVEAAEFQKELAGGAEGHLVRLRIAGDAGERAALVKAVQVDPIRGEAQHVDFQQVALDREVTTEVPVVLIGEQERPSDGGILSQVVRELSIACLPTQIPEHIAVDVSGLGVGDSLSVGELKLPAGVRLVHADPDETVVHVLAPAKQVEEAAPAEPAEPEVVGKKKADEAGNADQA